MLASLIHVISLLTSSCPADFPRNEDPRWVEVAVGYRLIRDCAIVEIENYDRSEISSAICWDHLKRSEKFGPALPGEVHPAGCPRHIGS